MRAIAITIALLPAAGMAQDVPTAAPAGRIDAHASFVTSFGNHYHAYEGARLQATFALVDTLSVGVDVGFLHGALTEIVVGNGGIIDNKMERCLGEAAQCQNVNPNLPGWAQITSLLEAVAVWSPLYLDALDTVGGSFEMYALFGAGGHGTRMIEAEALETRSLPSDYALRNDGFGDGGFFSDPRFHLTAGGGLRFGFLELLTARVELRAMFWWDEFDFGNGVETYAGHNLFVHLGLGVAL